MIFIIIIFEVIFALFGAWCILNEDELITFENKMAENIKSKISYKKHTKGTK